MDIVVDFDRCGTIVCPTCGNEGESCETETETWHHDNFFNYATFLHVEVPLIRCPCCGIALVERPWSREGSKFIRIDER